MNDAVFYKEKIHSAFSLLNLPTFPNEKYLSGDLRTEAELHELGHLFSLGERGRLKLLNGTGPERLSNVIACLPNKAYDMNEIHAIVLTIIVNRKLALGLDETIIINGTCTVHLPVIEAKKVVLEMLLDPIEVLDSFLNLFSFITNPLLVYKGRHE